MFIKLLMVVINWKFKAQFVITTGEQIMDIKEDLDFLRKKKERKRLRRGDLMEETGGNLVILFRDLVCTSTSSSVISFHLLA